MPSWKIHRKWAREYGIPEHIASAVDELIDKGGIHDLGEVKKPKIKAPTGTGIIEIPLKPTPTALELKYILESMFEDEDLAYAVKAAILHHFLDKVERFLREYGMVFKDDPDIVIDNAYGAMIKHGLNTLSEEELRSVYVFLKAHAREVVSDIVEGVGGKLPHIGPTILTQLLKEYVEKHGYSTLIYVSEITRPLPISAAARSILSRLKREGEVSIAFTSKSNTYYPLKKHKFRSLGELVKFLKSS